jgi:beta-galactosidase/evolved beta-galactosidase subunit alpha
MAFDRISGMISRWNVNGWDLVKTGPRLQFYRAPTDNDRGGWRDSLSDEWRKNGLHWLQHRIDSTFMKRADNRVLVGVKTRIAPPILEWGLDCEYTYSIDSSGMISIKASGARRGEFPQSFPRIGLELVLPANLSNCWWYGLGPGESYPDSKQAGQLGLWNLPMDDLYTPYIRPQENGNRSGVRWCAMVDERGSGLLASAENGFNFSAHRFSVEDLASTSHRHLLKPRAEIFLHLDHKQYGLGSASCGPGVLPQYRLEPKKFSFELNLKPVAAGLLRKGMQYSEIA